MPKYKVAIYGGMDGLTFEDLIVKYTSGYQYPLKIRKGSYVPVEIFDPLDIQKSLTVGSLRHYIDDGSVIIDYSDLEKKKKQRILRKKKKDIKDIKPTLKPSVEENKAEPSPETSQQKAEETKPANDEQIDLQDVKAETDFFKLSFFNKMQFIKNCKDKSLLSKLLEKLPEDAKQLKLHITYRLQNL